MDALDLKILKSMLREGMLCDVLGNFRKPLLEVAKEVGVDEGTVRNRLGRIQRSGFIRSRVTMVNPSTLRLRDLHVRFEVLPRSSKDDVVRKLKLVDGVYFVRIYMGDALALNILYDDPIALEKKVELIARIANAEVLTQLRGTWGPADAYKFSELDLKIVESLEDSPRKTYVEIARETGLKVGAVRRSIERMTEARALFVVQIWNYGALSGVAKGDLLITHDSKSSEGLRSKVRSLLGDRFLSDNVTPEASVYSAIMSNVAERREVLSKVNEMNGVREAFFDLEEELIYCPDTFKGLARKQSIRKDSPAKVASTLVE